MPGRPDRQSDMPIGSFGVLLFLNNCDDGTDVVATAIAREATCPVRIVEVEHDGATAGWARRSAMELAADWLLAEGADDGVILTTDADCRVTPTWIAENIAYIKAGADAVAGRIVLDAKEAEALPAALRARGRLEGAYEALLIEIGARLDPEPWNPWPCHWTTSGASLAVRRTVYKRIGGMPALAVGEDRAFVGLLRSNDALVRHAPGIVVTTSGRLDGRAPGGAADTMKLRCDDLDAPCDDRLETVHRAPLARGLASAPSAPSFRGSPHRNMAMVGEARHVRGGCGEVRGPSRLQHGVLVHRGRQSATGVRAIASRRAPGPDRAGTHRGQVDPSDGPAPTRRTSIR